VVRRRLQNFYQFDKGQFALTLTTARTLTIQITGAVAQPGTYTLSAYNTAFNALIAAGGPSKLGTVRNIQVINGGKVKNWTSMNTCSTHKSKVITTFRITTSCTFLSLEI
jgi:protein involved in polysaccharide export with SLBB domain